MAANPYVTRSAYSGVSGVATDNSSDKTISKDSAENLLVNTNYGLRPNIQQVSNPVATATKSNAYQKQYKEDSIMSMTQGELLLKLYAEIIKQLNLAVSLIDADKVKVYEDSTERGRFIEDKNKSLQKTQKIINHLRMTLNFEFEISDNLNSLYEFFLKCIRDANVNNESKPLKDIIPLVEDLYEAYTEAEKNVRSGK